MPRIPMPRATHYGPMALYAKMYLDWKKTRNHQNLITLFLVPRKQLEERARYLILTNPKVTITSMLSCCLSKNGKKKRWLNYAQFSSDFLESANGKV